MNYNNPFRSPLTQALGWIMALVVILFFWLAPALSAHAAGVYAHAPNAHKHRWHHARKPVFQPQPADPRQATDDEDSESFTLTPEQSAIVDWVLDSASPKLGYEQARKIVQYSYEQAQRLAIDPLAFIAVMRLESRFNPNARSNHGAAGLMQVMPRVHRAKLAGRSPYDIQTSIEVGGQILGECIDKFPDQLTRALNCYSGGGGKAYHQLFAHFNTQANHALIYSLFRMPDTSTDYRGNGIPEPLPKDDTVYQVALQ